MPISGTEVSARPMTASFQQHTLKNWSKVPRIIQLAFDEKSKLVCFPVIQIHGNKEFRG